MHLMFTPLSALVPMGSGHLWCGASNVLGYIGESITTGHSWAPDKGPGALNHTSYRPELSEREKLERRDDCAH